MTARTLAARVCPVMQTPYPGSPRHLHNNLTC